MIFFIAKFPVPMTWVVEACKFEGARIIRRVNTYEGFTKLPFGFVI